MTDSQVQTALDNYKTTYDQTYWNAGANDSNLSSSYWGTTNSEIGIGNTFGNASQCYGFSLFMALVLFDKRLDYLVVHPAPDGTDLGDGWVLYRNNYSSISLAPGDIVRGNNNEHSAVVHKIENGIVHFVECLGNGNNKIRWGGWNSQTASLNESQIKALATYIIKAPKQTNR